MILTWVHLYKFSRLYIYDTCIFILCSILKKYLFLKRLLISYHMRSLSPDGYSSVPQLDFTPLLFWLFPCFILVSVLFLSNLTSKWGRGFHFFIFLVFFFFFFLKMEPSEFQQDTWLYLTNLLTTYSSFLCWCGPMVKFGPMLQSATCFLDCLSLLLLAGKEKFRESLSPVSDGKTIALAKPLTVRWEGNAFLFI